MKLLDNLSNLSTQSVFAMLRGFATAAQIP
jgi:hypothetical protein